MRIWKWKITAREGTWEELKQILLFGIGLGIIVGCVIFALTDKVGR